MEELFAVKYKFFAQTVQKLQGQQAQGAKLKQRIRPKIPTRAQTSAANGKEKRHAAQQRDQLIDPQFSPCGTQGEEEQQRQHRQGVQQIQRRRKECFAEAKA